MAKMVKIKCSMCGYKFERKEYSMPKVCPYCGREETLAMEGTREYVEAGSSFSKRRN